MSLLRCCSWVLLLSVAFFGLLAGCGGGDSLGGAPPAPPPALPTLQSIAVTPVSPFVPRGQTQQFVATGTYSDGSTQNLTTATWTSSDTGKVTISADGLATTLAPGSTMISAAIGGVTGATTLTAPQVAWTWMSGSSTPPLPGSGIFGVAGVYGTRGMSAATNVPGSRESSVSWRDSSNKLWLFGGRGCGSDCPAYQLNTFNDLWKYDPATGQWTWMNGSSTCCVPGVHGTRGVPAASNNPGARYGSSSWTDGAGKLWLFGGTDFGYFAPFIELRFFNDLWRYDPVTGQWTWLKGSSSRDQSGIYGTQGAPAANTTPGARYGSGSWMDSAGKLWLFGGLGCGLFVMSACTPNDAVNDLWKYDPVSGQWAWMSGSSTTNADSVYGTQGIPSAANRPGARSGSATWIDGADKLWLFGGGRGGGVGGALNDLWKYDPVSGQWAWMSGSSTTNADSVYGTQGIPSAANRPGARSGSATWIDGAGKLWLFGGNGHSSSGSRVLNDLWKYDPGSGQWTWISGSSTPNALGVYGSQGMPSGTALPGARSSSVSWTDGAGKQWVFGGNGYSSSGSTGYLNDLWHWQQ